LGKPSKPGSAPKVGSPGIEPVEGRPGSEPSDGRPGTEGKVGSEVVDGRPGRVPVEGTPVVVVTDPVAPPEVEVDGTVGTAGRLGRPDGGVTQIWAPLVLEAWTETPPPGEVALALPDAVTGLGSAGGVGEATHCFPVGREVGRVGSVGGVARRDEILGIDETLGSDERPGTDGTLGTDKAESGL
jgi:hypothetical protein